MAMQVDAEGEARKRRLAMTAHHMTGQTSLGKVPGQEEAEAPAHTSPEYDPFEAGAFAQAWISNVLGGELVPVFLGASKRWFPDHEHPLFRGKYGPTVRSRSAIFLANTTADLIAGPIADIVRGVVHSMAPGLANKPKDGLGFELDPPNILAASLVKTVATGVAKTWLTTAFVPPPPPPPAPAPGPAPGPDSTPGPTPGPAPAPKAVRAAAPRSVPGASPSSATVPGPVRDAAVGPTFLGKDLKVIANETALWAVGYTISKMYDQTVGPLVQRSINTLMGEGDQEVKKPAPLTPGGLARAAASSFLSSLIIRPVAWPQPAAGPEGAAMGAAMPRIGLLSSAVVNGLIATAFDTVYNVGPGPAIEDGVNALAGLPKAPRKPETFTFERMLRTMARSGVSATTYYLVDGATQPIFQALGANMGVFGTFLSIAGPAISGMVGAGVVDALVGAKVGSLAGTVYEWISGNPKSENRPQAMPAPASAGAGAGAGAPDTGSPAPGVAPAVVTAGMSPSKRRRAAGIPTTAASGGGWSPMALARVAAATVA